MPLGTEVGLSPGDVVLDGTELSPRKRAQQLPHFSAHFAMARSPISVTAKLLYRIVSTSIILSEIKFVSDIAVFVLKRDVKLQPTNCQK